MQAHFDLLLLLQTITVDYGSIEVLLALMLTLVLATPAGLRILETPHGARHTSVEAPALASQKD